MDISHLSLFEHITSQAVDIVFVHDFATGVSLCRCVNRYNFYPKLCEARVVDDGFGIREAVPSLLLRSIHRPVSNTSSLVPSWCLWIDFSGLGLSVSGE